MNTKRIGNKAEAKVLAFFVERGIPVAIPFGDNEKYDLILDIRGVLKKVQVKTGTMTGTRFMTVICKYKKGAKRIQYETYEGKVDYIAVWCEYTDDVYLLEGDLLKKTSIILRLDPPKNNSSISTVNWATDYLATKVLKEVFMDE